LKTIYDVVLTEPVRVAICILVACKLIKQPLPLSFFTLEEKMGGLSLTQQEQRMVFQFESKFCEHFGFRLHISPEVAFQSSTSDSF
jgi:hypothetical protein